MQRLYAVAPSPSSQQHSYLAVVHEYCVQKLHLQHFRYFFFRRFYMSTFFVSVFSIHTVFSELLIVENILLDNVSKWDYVISCGNRYVIAMRRRHPNDTHEAYIYPWSIMSHPGILREVMGMRCPLLENQLLLRTI